MLELSSKLSKSLEESGTSFSLKGFSLNNIRF